MDARVLELSILGINSAECRATGIVVMIDSSTIRQDMSQGTFRPESAISLLEIFAWSPFGLLL